VHETRGKRKVIRTHERETQAAEEEASLIDAISSAALGGSVPAPDAILGSDAVLAEIESCVHDILRRLVILEELLRAQRDSHDGD
jgi:predicted transcriptional regulator